MTPALILSFVLGYFALLMLISRLTGRRRSHQTFFLANRNAPWFVVAFGMVGATLSGITFISVPGWVGDSQFAYMQMVFGYMAGYLVVGTILLPLYYRLKLTSIYAYLGGRFGPASYKTGTFYFMLSRVIGAAFRLYLVAMVLQAYVFDDWQVPFWMTVVITILFIWIYTFRSGIQTIIWTDTLQTTFMLLAVGLSVYYVMGDLSLSLSGLGPAIADSGYAQMFFWDYKEAQFFFKQFLSGALITIAMTGLDQDMMQKNLSCRNIGDAQKNMFWFSITLLVVKLLFLVLGALLYMYVTTNNLTMPARSDELFPFLAIEHFSVLAGAVFLLGLIAAAYSSADSALTSLTTAFCVDILGFDDKKQTGLRTRYLVHIGFSVLLLAVIMVFRLIHDEAIISKLFKAASYTYGPLLGLFSFGLCFKRAVRDRWVPLVCILSPIICYIININAERWFNGYEIGFELLGINGLLTFIGLWLLSIKYKSYTNIRKNDG